MDNIERVPLFAMKNRQALAESDLGGCYHCMQSFSVHAIEQWTDNGETALCPLCEVDAVIPQSSGILLDEDTLQVIHDRWFTPEVK